MGNGENSEENWTTASYRVNELSILRERMRAVQEKGKKRRGKRSVIGTNERAEGAARK